MVRTLSILCLAAFSLSAKDRAWQSGTVLDKTLNPYIRAVETGGKSRDMISMNGSTAVGVNVHASDGDVAYDNFVIEGTDKVYLVELSRLKSFKAPHVSLSRPLNFAVEKDKLWIRDLDNTEYETRVLKQIDKPGVAVASASPAPAAPTAVEQVKPAPAKAEQAKVQPAKVEQAKPEQTKVEAAKVEKPKPSKPDSVFATAALPKEDNNPPKPKPVTTAANIAAPPVAAPAPAAVISQKPQPEPKPEAPVARVSAKDRAWQSGKLLSVANNNYFFNVTYSSDTDGSYWPFVQGSDGRYTVNGQIGIATRSAYTYDNYVVESPFVAYLVQRMRPKTSPPVRLPGAAALKFAVEKSKMWVLDEEGKEYETRIVKLIQKDAIVDPLARASAK
jgi:hypothetical protein